MMYKWQDLVKQWGITPMSNKDLYRREAYKALLKGDEKENLQMFNRFNLPEGYLYHGGLRGYVLFTRPDCNIMKLKEKGMPLVEKLRGRSGFSAFIAENSSSVDSIKNITNQTALKVLQHNTGHPSAFINYFTNGCKGYTPEDQIMDTVDKGDTHHGIKLSYAKHSMHSRTAGTISLTFQDTKDFPIYKTLCLWTDYIEAVYLGDCDPSDYYIKYGIVDYAISIYYIVVRDHITGDVEASKGQLNLSSQEIVYWEKLTGVFPITRPDSAFATTVDNFSYPEFNVQFKYSIKSKSGILDPYLLSELNKLSDQHHSRPHKIAQNTYTNRLVRGKNIGYTMHGQPFVANPRVQRWMGKFYLTWDIIEDLY